MLDVLDSGWLTTGRQDEAVRGTVRGPSWAPLTRSRSIRRRPRSISLSKPSGSGRATRSSSRPGRSRRAPRSSPTGARRRSLSTSTRARSMPRPGTSLAAVTPRTSAVVAVHFAGFRSRSSGSSRLSSPGASPLSRTRRTRSRAVSAAPRAATSGRSDAPAHISFYATKTITTGEGGMLVTDDDGRRRSGAAHVPARDQPGRLESIRGGRLVVLRDRGRRLQVQHDGHRGGDWARPARSGGGAARGTRRRLAPRTLPAIAAHPCGGPPGAARRHARTAPTPGTST